MFPYLAIVSAALAAALVSAPAISRSASTLPSLPVAHHFAAKLPLMLAQDDSVSDEDAVPTDQVDKYIAVYSAMQKNHGLTVDQAAPKQGLTVDEFRTLEDKIARNPVVHQRVLDALKASSSGGKATSASGSSKPK
jgi:hypothetical protein